VAKPIIEVKDLTKIYDGKRVVDRLNLTLHEGEVYGLLGPNGAGKSTTILMLLGLTEPSEGTVTIAGIDATRNPVEVKKLVGYLPEDVGFYDHMSGLENIVYTGMLNGLSRMESEQRALKLLSRVGLENEVNKKVGKYSRGMRQRLGLADVLVKNPKVIILDEPTLGIDPSGMREFLELIVQLSREDKITVLFSSHHLHQVQQVCDRVAIFVGGKLIAEGKIDELSQKLFTHGNCQVEFAIDEEVEMDQIKRSLQSVRGITRIEREEPNFVVECENDVTSQIARSLIESGYNLRYLNRKKFGLDEIYQRYFVNA
jgi:ABC-2 type transport system ATP-binding protein